MNCFVLLLIQISTELKLLDTIRALFTDNLINDLFIHLPKCSPFSPSDWSFSFSLYLFFSINFHVIETWIDAHKMIYYPWKNISITWHAQFNHCFVNRLTLNSIKLIDLCASIFAFEENTPACRCNNYVTSDQLTLIPKCRWKKKKQKIM